MSDNKVGRPSKYDPKYVDEILEFFNRENYTIVQNGKKRIKEPCDLPTLAGFCRKLLITRKTLWNWTEKYPEFLHAYSVAKEIQEDILQQNALAGLYDAGFAWRLGKNICDWRDKQEINQTSSIEINIDENESRL